MIVESSIQVWRHCKWCNKQLPNPNRRIKYCSAKCRDDYHADRQAEVNKERKAKRLAVSVPCTACHKPFVRTSGKQKLCSECRRPPHTPASKERECRACGDAFTRKGRNQRYCSDECREELQRIHKRASTEALLAQRIICPECDKPFTRKYIIQVVCSKECRHKRAYATAKVWNQTEHGRRKRIEIVTRYNKTEKGKASIKRAEAARKAKAIKHKARKQ